MKNEDEGNITGKRRKADQKWNKQVCEICKIMEITITMVDCI